MVKSVVKNVVKDNQLFFYLLIIISIIVVLLSLIPAQLLRIIIDDNLKQGLYVTLLRLGIIYLGIIILNSVFNCLKNYLLLVFGQKVAKNIRKKMSLKLANISPQYFTNNSIGDLSSRFINDVDALNSLFTDGIISMGIDLFKIVGIIVSILVFNTLLGLIVIVIIPILYLIINSFRKNMLKSQIKNRLMVGILNNRIYESIKNILMIKTYHIEDYICDNYVNDLENNYHTLTKVYFYDAIFSPVITIIKALLIAFVVILVYYSTENNYQFLGISIGTIALCIEYIGNLFSPIDNLGMELQSIQKAIAGGKRINEFLELLEEQKKVSILQFTDLTKKEQIQIKEIIFENVSFAYDENNYILNNLSFTINNNEKIILIGRTGVGKTTTFKLIMGLIKPTEGSIKIKDINNHLYDVADLDDSLRSHLFGYVSQSSQYIKVQRLFP